MPKTPDVIQKTVEVAEANASNVRHSGADLVEACCVAIELLHRQRRTSDFRREDVDPLLSLIRDDGGTLRLAAELAEWRPADLLAGLAPAQRNRICQYVHQAAEQLDASAAQSHQTGDTAVDAAASIDLYELWLDARRGKLRGKRGVYYTPPVLADFVVEQTDRQLIQMGFSRGLIDPDLDARQARMIDPAAGSGVFMTAAIRLARQRWQSTSPAGDDWPACARRLLLRMAANELMSTAALIGQLRVLWQLLDTGLDIQQLVPLAEASGSLCDWRVIDTLAADDHRTGKLPIVFGNPPYLSRTPMTQTWIERMMRGDANGIATCDYYSVGGQPLGERKVWLQDSYVRFLRWAHWQVERAGWGVVSLVLNHGLFENVTFRGIREKLLQEFDVVEIVDLHGNVKAKEQSPNGEADQNVFAITTGVGVLTLGKHPAKCGADGVETRTEPTTATATVHRVDLWGARSGKLSGLQQWSVESPPWQSLVPQAPHFLFAEEPPVCESYQSAPRITELMPVHCTAPVTARDRLIIDRCPERLRERLELLADLSISDATIREQFFPKSRSSRYPRGDTRGWKLADARRQLAELASQNALASLIRVCLYRPFDWRHVAWADWLVDWSRPAVTRHFGLNQENVALIARRQMLPTQPCNYFWSTREIPIDGVIRSDNRGGESLFPLWLVDGGHVRANFSAPWVDAFAKSTGLRWHESEDDRRDGAFRPIDLLHYVYGLFFCDAYRDRYAEQLRRDFPRVLVPDAELFELHRDRGAKLLGLHAPKAKRTDPVDSVSPSEHHVGDESHSFTFAGRQWRVSREVWEYRVGGYQVIPKWLKPRQRDPLGGDVESLARMIATLSAVVVVAQPPGPLGPEGLGAARGGATRP